ncbi:MAG: glycosyltransferase family 4 protein [Desulfuromonadaceae bacterium]|nr:glycosyltransferase family 4 protein [Desulfuromonadaceae bacterium]
MRVLFVVPEQPRTTGNWVTALRHEQGLVSLGHEVRLVETVGSVANLERQVAEFKPDLIHLLHAYRAGRPWLGCRQQGAIPSVVSLTGTDLNHGLDSAEQGPQICTVLEQATAIIIQNQLTVESFAVAHTGLAARLHHVAPGVSLGSDPYPLRQRHALSASSILFLLPAGIRPVKANLELLQLFDLVAEAAPFCQLLFCGSILDQGYGQRFQAALQARPWAHYLGEIPASAMAAVLREVDVVLNHSVSEGLPNVLLEAAALGRPILARDIPGNRAAFMPDLNGLLYDSSESFVRQALALIRNPALRQRLVLPMQKIRTSVDEALQLEKVYQGLPVCRPLDSSSSLHAGR